MKKLLMAIMLVSSLNASVDQDKFDHAFIGALVYGGCLVAGGILDSLDYTHPLDGATCLVPVFVVGAGKEIYDSNKEGNTAEFSDFAATVAIPIGLSFVIYKW